MLTPGLTGWAQVNGRDELPVQLRGLYYLVRPVRLAWKRLMRPVLACFKASDQRAAWRRKVMIKRQSAAQISRKYGPFRQASVPRQRRARSRRSRKSTSSIQAGHRATRASGWKTPWRFRRRRRRLARVIERLKAGPGRTCGWSDRISHGRPSTATRAALRTLPIT